MAGYLRITRSSMLEILDSEFIRLARGKGASGTAVIWKHALRNSLIQPITLSTLLLAGLLNGTLVAEAVFAWPGLGRTMLEAVEQQRFSRVDRRRVGVRDHLCGLQLDCGFAVYRCGSADPLHVRVVDV